MRLITGMEMRERNHTHILMRMSRVCPKDVTRSLLSAKQELQRGRMAAAVEGNMALTAA